ncbi:glycoside hydrolase family 79 protein [Lentithecium fluviatile CBS 122367]|uniref:Glycoside hydrolase family 79 protein n=1 Tax=Lentithecium fluviatile CBS 122367 TaxID=1168545 RepID=A0A6G1J6M4_9PLEO|nr:glycoside hydrolase family 79 protein [Lentithecium fluviatile CBS 122367]
MQSQIVELSCSVRWIYELEFSSVTSVDAGIPRMWGSNLRYEIDIDTCAASGAVKLVIPNAPPAGTQTLDGAFERYSMEMASFVDLAGNLSAPNKLSIRMLQNLKDITGSAAPIRVDGATANHATYFLDQKEAIIAYYATPGADQPANLTLGQEYLQSFHTFPKALTTPLAALPTAEPKEMTRQPTQLLQSQSP